MSFFGSILNFNSNLEWFLLFNEGVTATVCCAQALPTDAQMAEVAEKWRPYRSLGSYYMWRVPTTKSPSLKKSKSAPVGVTL